MGRSVFITGAAAGIGRATARAFADRRYTVGAYDIDEAGLATLADEIETGRVLDAVIAQNESQTRNMWRIREAVALCEQLAGEFSHAASLLG